VTVFAGHGWQVKEELDASVALKVLGPHVVQAVEPNAALKDPAGQGAAGLPGAPKNPTFATQSLTWSWSAAAVPGAMVLAGHRRHVDAAVAPTVALYVLAPQTVGVVVATAAQYAPAGHGEASVPAAPKNPILATQSVRSLRSDGSDPGVKVLLGQPRQDDTEVAAQAPL
jgi:hypothetical protein